MDNSADTRLKLLERRVTQQDFRWSIGEEKELAAGQEA
jgi:hypothetical protein